jgi:hypothetical protein
VVESNEAAMNQRTTHPGATDTPQTGDASAPCTEFMMPTGATPDHEGPICGSGIPIATRRLFYKKE